MKKQASESILMDQYGRRLTYLRLSVTDRCNLRCIYCAPQQAFSWMPHDEVLRYEEILTIAQVLGKMGLRKIRLTGGEPLVRYGILDLARDLAQLPGIREVCITTNGVLLADLAPELYAAGVRHINISLDTLDPALFATITGRNLFGQVWNGILSALDQGFDPIKINAVIMKGINDHEIERLAELSTRYAIQVRFIEFMPVGSDSNWSEDRLVTCEEIMQRIESGLGTLTKQDSGPDSGPAAIYSLDGAPGTLGFISPLSNHFCASCNRIRLTADGRLRLCLFSDHEIDVKKVLRRGISPKELGSFFRRAVHMKPKGHQALENGHLGCRRTMSSIGG